MATQPVLLVGASCRAAAEALRRIGVHSIAWDMFADRDTSHVCDVRRIESLKREQAAGIFKIDRSLVLPCGGLENATALWEELSRVHELLGPTSDQLAKLRDPFWLSSFCSSASSEVSFPEIRSSVDELAAGRRWLVKSAKSAAGLGVRFLKNDELLAEHEFAQAFVVGVEFGVSVQCGDGKCRILSATMPYPKDMETRFHYAGSLGPVTIPTWATSRIEEFFGALASELRFSGVLQADLMLEEDKVCLLEINPRWTAGMEIVEALNPGSLLGCCETYRGERLPVDSDASHSPLGEFVLKRIVYAAHSFVVDQQLSDRWMNSRDWAAIGKSSELTALRFRLADIPRANTAIERGQPVCTMFVAGRFIDGRAIELGSYEKIASLRRLTDGLNPLDAIEEMIPKN